MYEAQHGVTLPDRARCHLHLEKWPVLLLDAAAHIAARLGGCAVDDRARRRLAGGYAV